MKTFKLLSKIALLLVVFGFFQPVACDQQGFELAESLMEMGEVNYTVSAIGLYIAFFAAVISILISLILLITRKNICSSKINKIDFALLLASIVGGLITFFFVISEFEFDFIDYGFYIIISGWILSIIFSCFAKK